jgi:hypothetical protein
MTQKDTPPDPKPAVEKEFEEIPTPDFEEKYGIDPKNPTYEPVPDEKKH